MRYLGRTRGLYGDDGSAATAAAVDMLMDAVEDFRNKYLLLIYSDQLAEPAKQAYEAKHLLPSGMEGAPRNGGCHYALLEAWLARAGGPWAVGGSPTIADLQLFDLLDLHARVFPGALGSYPRLAGLHARVAGLGGIKEYLAGPRRPAKINGNSLG